MAAPDQSTIIPAATGGSPQRDDNDATSSPPIGLVGPSINRTPPPFSRQCDMDVVCGGTWISDTGSRHTDSFSDNGGLPVYAIAACMKHVSSLRQVLGWLKSWRGSMWMV
ncbi:hypothetical protein COCMIDRAFT_38483 [Bipolaris oryzae ATCC 44560]|uniref:Uncharacterized protein n=1 Tax=Bipolaris oryzae ATCC 44560 TaxID=930090 RepID=W6YW15_COCMI|nr:uncharacterized protein COCMIDRAFT_38483 [Bipolaris oryzae ATCC 44560]EUC43612.1 hypothetical protein COCMIDRAFT_38483 [Bipolaris oryzae ATCC 44560]